MITLATGMAFFYLAQQNYSLLNGHSGFRGVAAPVAFGVAWRNAVPFYYLCFAVAALFYCAVVYTARSTFGLALMASRDNPRRARAVGHNVTTLRVAAFFLAGLIAGAAGVLYVWFNGRISPGTVSVSEAVGVLVIAVIGGLGHPLGPFLGAALYVLLKTFAIDVVGADRFNRFRFARRDSRPLAAPRAGARTETVACNMRGAEARSTEVQRDPNLGGSE